MAITRYEPSNLFNQPGSELERGGEDKNSEGSIATEEWKFAGDINEEANKFVSHAHTPDIKPEEIEVSMQAWMLSLKGEKSQKLN